MTLSRAVARVRHPEPSRRPILDALRRGYGIDPDDPRLPQLVIDDVVLISDPDRPGWCLTFTSPDGGNVDRHARHPGELLDWLERFAVGRGMQVDIPMLSIWTKSTHPDAEVTS